MCTFVPKTKSFAEWHLKPDTSVTTTNLNVLTVKDVPSDRLVLPISLYAIYYEPKRRKL